MKTFLITISLALAPAAFADTIILTLDGNFNTPDYAFYTYTDTSGQTDSNIPVDPYITSMTGQGYANALAYTFCYDFNSPTYVGVAYTGEFETLTDTATLEATYLINELNGVGLINAPLATRGAISFAIWEIMNPSSTTKILPFPSDPAAQGYETQAASAVASGAWTAADSAHYPTWVPDDPSIQRFGIVLPNEIGSPVPEPGTLLLFGLGFLSMGLLGRKRRLQAGVAKRGA